jgi:hypothetical protein
MADRRADWAALRGLFDSLPATAGKAPSAAEVQGVDAVELARDLAEERAAIMEYVGGMTRAEAEKLACKPHGLDVANIKTRNPAQGGASGR